MTRNFFVFGRCDHVLNKFFVQSGLDYVTFSSAEDFNAANVETVAQLAIIDSELGLRRNCELCRQLRTKLSAPLVILTNYHDEQDELAALASGCTAYYPKTGDSRLLYARLSALIGLSNCVTTTSPTVTPLPENQQIKLGSLTVDSTECRVSLRGQPVELTAMEYKILELLVKNINRTFNRQQIIDGTQGFSFEGFERTIDSHIKNLRKKLAEFAPGESYIKTVYGLGYKISAPTILQS